MGETIDNIVCENEKINYVKLTSEEIEITETFFEKNLITTRLVQEKLHLGFAAASRIIDSLEYKKIIGLADVKNAKYELLITKKQFETLKNN